ncbi:hypothetical protein H7H37_01200, partial [Mycolicibacterium insubricum]|nr:hypothetical protein [Mycolicibacterium insubricum]
MDSPSTAAAPDWARFVGHPRRELQTFANKLYDEAWNPETYMITIKAIV